MAPTLIYCAGNNPTFDRIALNAGFLIGVRLPDATTKLKVYFADQNWKKPDRKGYMAALAEHRPTMATVLDWEQEDQKDEVLDWAEEAAQYVEQVVIIPKIFGAITNIPRRIGDAEIVLGYSVPTKYGGTFVPVWEFSGWPVHLLGGSAHKQMEVGRYMNVVSVDGNYHLFKATKFCEYWKNKRWHKVRPKQKDAPLIAFEKSCHNIVSYWTSHWP